MKSKKAFTLVELLVVIAILAVLTSISVIGYSSFIKSSKASNANLTETAITEYISSELVLQSSFSLCQYYLTDELEEGHVIASYSTYKKYATKDSDNNFTEVSGVVLADTEYYGVCEFVVFAADRTTKTIRITSTESLDVGFTYDITSLLDSYPEIKIAEDTKVYLTNVREVTSGTYEVDMTVTFDNIDSDGNEFNESNIVIVNRIN